MFRLPLFRSPILCWMTSTVWVCLFATLPSARSADNTPPERSMYHADAQHLWNRLYEALFVRVGQDARTYGRDRLDPLLWPETRYLLEFPDHDRAVKVLNEFVDNHGEQLIEEPLKRAVLQRDLWLVFNWLQKSELHGVPRGTPVENRDEAKQRWRDTQKRLRQPLVEVIRRLALTPDQISILPDNYAAAVASGEFAKQFDLERPNQPFLPADLFATDGPWVCVGADDGPVAPEHQCEDRGNPVPNSAFLVFLKLPEGRAATLAYLKEPRPFLAGTEVALVRRTLLVTSSHTVVPTALTENIQLRVYRERSEQSVSEFRWSRPLLFANRHGGLRPVGADERDFKTGFSAHPGDELEYSYPGQTWDGTRRTRPILADCRGCHNSRFFDFKTATSNNTGSRRAVFLFEISLSDALSKDVKRKQQSPDWSALQKLLSP